MGRGVAIFATEFSCEMIAGGSFEMALEAGSSGLYKMSGMVVKYMFYTQVAGVVCSGVAQAINKKG